MDFIHYP